MVIFLKNLYRKLSYRILKTSEYERMLQNIETLTTQVAKIQELNLEAQLSFPHTLTEALKKNSHSEKRLVLVVSPNYKGGGLETRLNSLFNRLKEKYSFILLTETPFEDMKKPPPLEVSIIIGLCQSSYPMYIKSILALFPVYFIHIHPFYTEWIADLPEARNIKISYTIHGEASLNLLSYTPARPFDYIFTVSKKLIPFIQEKGLGNKRNIIFTPNRFENFSPPPLKKIQKIKKILVSYTNTTGIQDLLNFLSAMPFGEVLDLFFVGAALEMSQAVSKAFPDHRIHILGFVNIPNLLKSRAFDMGLCRGGFAAMDLIAHNIPTFLLYDRNSVFYATLLNRDNFQKLFNQNFVSWDKCEDPGAVIPLGIAHITQDPAYYQCADLLSQKCMNEPLIKALERCYNVR